MDKLLHLQIQLQLHLISSHCQIMAHAVKVHSTTIDEYEAELRVLIQKFDELWAEGQV